MKKIRRNEFLLLEQDDDAPKGGLYTPPKERMLQYPDVADSMIETNASLDQIVDRYLLQYEKEAVPLNIEPEEKLPQRQPVAERKQHRSYFYRFIMEQDVPPADAGAPPGDTGGGDTGEGDTGGGDTGGGDTGGGTEPGAEATVVPVPKINIRHFAQGVARLANNYQSLIDPKTVILTRAMYYISKNYSPRLAKEMMSILERDFGLTPKSMTQQKNEEPVAPRQGNAGPDSGGGVPSGGGK